MTAQVIPFPVPRNRAGARVFQGDESAFAEARRRIQELDVLVPTSMNPIFDEIRLSPKQIAEIVVDEMFHRGLIKA